MKKTEVINNIVVMVMGADPHRSTDNVLRRLVKLAEEAGEAAEAYLQNTSEHNLKNKTDDDVREEVADTLIMAVDVALTFITFDEVADAMELSSDIGLFVDFGGVLASGGALLSMLAWEQEGIPANMELIRQQSSLVCKHAYGMCLSLMGDTLEAREALTEIVEKKVGKWKRQAANRTDSITTPK